MSKKYSPFAPFTATARVAAWSTTRPAICTEARAVARAGGSVRRTQRRLASATWNLAQRFRFPRM
eukprot:8377855-Alexandrium_andersonii.AAC.1